MTNRVLDKSELAAPGSPEWARIVTASKIPTILGLNPYETASELWMVMSGLSEPEQLEGDHLQWGHLAEDSLVNFWKYKNPGWRTGRGEIAYTDNALPFENQATLDRRASRGSKRHIIECKTSDSKVSWEDGLPSWYYAQAMAQMGISGIHTASVVGQLYSTVPKIYEVEWDNELWEGIVDQVHDFVGTLGNAEPPIPDSSLLATIAEGALSFDDDVDVNDLDGVTLSDWEFAKDQYDAAKAHLDWVKKQFTKAAGGRRVTHTGKVFMAPTKGRFSASKVPDEARHLLTHPDVLTPKLDNKKLAQRYPQVYESGLGDTTYTFKNIWK